MGRESKRDKERLERQHERAGESGSSADAAAAAGGSAPGKTKERTSAGQFIREVRSELSRVHWPDRKQLTQYSIAVLIFVILITTYIFFIDQIFGQLVLWVFG